MYPFEVELREAQRIIREQNDNPDDFTRTPKKKTVGSIFIAREYTLTVSRGKFPPATYEGGRGENWVCALCAQAWRSVIVGRCWQKCARCVPTGPNSTSAPLLAESSS